MGSTDGNVLGSDEVIKVGISDGKVLGDILVYVYIITLDIDAGTELGSLDGSYGVGNLEGSFMGE